VAQRVGRGIALLFHNRGTRRGWVVSSTPRPQFTHGKDTVPILQGSGPEGSRKLSFPDFMTTEQDGDKSVSLRKRPPLPPGNTPGTLFCYRLSRPQGYSAIRTILCQWKISMTTAVFESATFRLISQHLNHCATAVPTNRSAMGNESGEVMELWRISDEDVGKGRKNEDFTAFGIQRIRRLWGVSVISSAATDSRDRALPTRMVHDSHFGFKPQENAICSLITKAYLIAVSKLCKHLQD